MEPNQGHLIKNYMLVFLSLTFKPNPYLNIFINLCQLHSPLANFFPRKQQFKMPNKCIIKI